MFFIANTISKMIDHVKRMPGLSGYEGKCLYRDPDGNRCLLGLFIPDELYREAWDEVGWDEDDDDDSGWPLVVGSPIVKAIEVGLKREGLMPEGASLTPEDVSILRALQKCHDYGVQDEDGTWVDSSVDLGKWRAAVINRLEGIWYVEYLLQDKTS